MCYGVHHFMWVIESKGGVETCKVRSKRKERINVIEMNIKE